MSWLYKQGSAPRKGNPHLAGISMGRDQPAPKGASKTHSHSLQVKPWRCGITFHTDTLNEQKMPCIIFSSVTTSLQSSAAGTLHAVRADPHMCLRWKGSLAALPTPSKQLSRQKNSTNSRAQVRWLHILSAFFGDYNISTPRRHPCYMDCKKNLQSKHHTITT